MKYTQYRTKCVWWGQLIKVVLGFVISVAYIIFMFVIGLADDVCLPHFVYSAYHHAGGDKKLFVYPFQPHTEIKDSKNLIHEEFANM